MASLPPSGVGDCSSEARVEASDMVGGGGCGATVAGPVENKTSIMSNLLLRWSEPEEVVTAAYCQSL